MDRLWKTGLQEGGDRALKWADGATLVSGKAMMVQRLSPGKR